jgi:glycosyltransferase involved in cell wall biosynthesis
LNILFDGRPIRNPISGVARYCIDKTNALSILGRQRGIDVDLYCQNWRGKNKELENQTPNLQAELHIDRKINSKIKNILWEFLPDIIHGNEFKKKYDIVHESYFASLGNSRVKGSRCLKVSTIHDVIPIDHPEWFNLSNRYFSKRNLERQCKDSDHIICVSEYTKRRVIELFPNTCDITVLPLGVNVPKNLIDSGLLNQLDIEEKKYLFYIGNIEPRKNLNSYVKAIEPVLRRDKSLKFVIAGHQNYLAGNILKPILEEFPEQIIYLGKITEELKWTLLKYAKFAVFPSLYEGFGIPVIEAYSVGTPIVFSDNSSLSELALKREHLFDPKNLHDMLKTTENLLYSSDLRNELSIKGLERAKCHNWNSVASATLDIYSNILK